MSRKSAGRKRSGSRFFIETVGLPALDVLDPVCGREVNLILHEDNQAAIQVIKTGRNPTMRSLQRSHGIRIRFLHDLFSQKMM